MLSNNPPIYPLTIPIKLPKINISETKISDEKIVLDAPYTTLENTHLPKTDKVNELVGKEVNRVKEENHGRLNEGEGMKKVEEDTVDWPSNKLTLKQKRNIWKLVDEYIDTMVIPYLNDDFDEDLVADMSGGLFEFAAWILTKEED